MYLCFELGTITRKTELYEGRIFSHTEPEDQRHTERDGRELLQNLPPQFDVKMNDLPMS